MKTIRIEEMSDEHWKLYAGLDEKLYMKYYPEDANKKSDWQDLKKERWNDFETLKEDFADFYLILENEEAAGWLGLRLVNSDAVFVFDAAYDEIPDEAMETVFGIVKKYMTDRGKTEVHSYSKNDRLINALKKYGGKILDRKIFSRLNKNEIDTDSLREIVKSVSGKNNYKLDLYDTIPEEILDKYLPVYNEARFDMNENNPNKPVFVNRTKDDLRKKLKWDKGPEDKMFLYILFDGEDIAALCSLFIRKENEHMIDQAGGLTTVGRKYRGQNLAKFLKAKMYLKMIEEYPDFEFIRTDTYPWNKYMYRINEEMGFKPYEEYCEFKFSY